MKKIIKFLFLFIIILLLPLFCYFFVGKAPEQKNIVWGVNFSQMQAENFKLDWKKTYLALMDDLKVKNIKIATNWDFIEGEKDEYYFNDIDWQIKEAEKRDIKLILVVGIKSGRWPECHDPSWARALSIPQEQQQVLDYIEQLVLRYKDSKAIKSWQVENEPLFNFGKCPWRDKNFLAEEVKLVKSLNSSRPVIISDSGEQSMWFKVAKISDIFGTTMYREGWVHITDKFGFYGYSPIPPVFYWRKAQLIKYFLNKNTICVELQAEPWGPVLVSDLSLEEQKKTMNLERFKDNIEFAQKTGLDTFYLWGAEWWYWMKEKQNQPEIWNEAKKLFNE